MCFGEIVGLKEVDTNLLCEFWINDLTGFTTELVENLKNTDHVFLVSFWEKIKKNAYNNLKLKFEVKFYNLFSVYCSQRADINNILPQILCQHKNIFKSTYLNAVALELLKEQRYSKQINYYTSVHEEETKELLGYYLKEFETSFENAMKAVTPPQDEFVTEKKFPYQVSHQGYITP